MNAIRSLMALVLLALLLCGCPPRVVDVDEHSAGDLRSNRGGAPPTGLKQNPGSPRPERPLPAGGQR